MNERWSSGNTKRIAPGDRLFLMRLGAKPRGIVASGWAVSAPSIGPHWNTERARRGDASLYVDAEFERILDPGITAPLAHRYIEQRLPSFGWSPQASGVEIPHVIATVLETLWAAHVGSVALNRSEEAEFAAYEGELRLLVVRHRRREQRVRHEKIRTVLHEKGRLLCEVPGCGFDFEARYGAVAHAFAHVHHLKPLAALDSPRWTMLHEVAIVCADCHAIIHLNGQCRPLDGLIRTDARVQSFAGSRLTAGASQSPK